MNSPLQAPRMRAAARRVMAGGERFLGGVLAGATARRLQIRAFADEWAAANLEARQETGPLWVVLGDSVSQGIGSTTRETSYVGVTHEMLRRREAWRVINLSKAEAGVLDVLARQLPELIAITAKEPVALVSCIIGAEDLSRRTPGLDTALRQVVSALPPGSVLGLLPHGTRAAAALNSVIREEAERHAMRIAILPPRLVGPLRGRDGRGMGDVGHAAWARAVLAAADGPAAVAAPATDPALPVVPPLDSSPPTDPALPIVPPLDISPATDPALPVVLPLDSRADPVDPADPAESVREVADPARVPAVEDIAVADEAEPTDAAARVADDPVDAERAALDAEDGLGQDVPSVDGIGVGGDPPVEKTLAVEVDEVPETVAPAEPETTTTDGPQASAVVAEPEPVAEVEQPDIHEADAAVGYEPVPEHPAADEAEPVAADAPDQPVADAAPVAEPKPAAVESMPEAARPLTTDEPAAQPAREQDPRPAAYYNPEATGYDELRSYAPVSGSDLFAEQSPRRPDTTGTAEPTNGSGRAWASEPVEGRAEH